MTMNPALNPISSTKPIDARRANAPTASSRPTAPPPNREAFEPAAAARKAGGPGTRPARRIGDRALYEADWLESMDRMTNAAIARATDLPVYSSPKHGAEAVHAPADAPAAKASAAGGASQAK